MTCVKNLAVNFSAYSLLFKETLENDSLGDHNSALLEDPHGINDIELQEADLTGSIMNDNKMNEIFVFHSNPPQDPVSPDLNIDPDIHIPGLIKKIIEETLFPYKQHEERSVYNLASLTPAALGRGEVCVHLTSFTRPKNPLASLDLLKKRICLSNLPQDPFSFSEWDYRLGMQAGEVLAETRPSLQPQGKADDADQLNQLPVEVMPELSPQHHTQEKTKHQKAKRPAGRMRVRQSKRLKTKPLKYWKGERLLYGRVNESVKLIGLKLLSPAQGSLVKSYISDDYKDVAECG